VSSVVRSRAPLSDGLAAAGLGLALRLGVVAWAWHRIPPAADGTFYDTIARRIANGQGYTWLWPDGTVTYAAHYPVGYPALVAASYRLFGAQPSSAMLAGALLGALGVLAVHRALAPSGSRRRALAAALLLAVHPGLVSYTPALMTEGVTASLIAVAMWAFVRADEARGAARLAWTACLGVVVGASTYVRPQSVVLGPLLAVVLASSGSWRERLRAAAAPVLVTTAVAVALVAPWTLRNCERMGRCAFVSVNGGWNLLIGTDRDAHGTWAEVKVPVACRSVFDEAEKDACFGREARREILEHPTAWAALAPSKVAATFDYAGAGPWYLHAASPDAFPDRAKLVVAAAELVFERVLVLAAILGVFRRLRRSASRVARVTAYLALASASSLASIHGAIAVVGLVLALAVWAASRDPAPATHRAALVVLGSTLVIHAVFFGAGRYSLVAFPAIVAVATWALPAGGRSAFDRDAEARAS
jgi:4-amino-4-deoxy-L-arabinose transferase-like glycosyltransferase